MDYQDETLEAESQKPDEPMEEASIKDELPKVPETKKKEIYWKGGSSSCLHNCSKMPQHPNKCYLCGLCGHQPNWVPDRQMYGKGPRVGTNLGTQVFHTNRSCPAFGGDGGELRLFLNPHLVPWLCILGRMTKRAFSGLLWTLEMMFSVGGSLLIPTTRPFWTWYQFCFTFTWLGVAGYMFGLFAMFVLGVDASLEVLSC